MAKKPSSKAKNTFDRDASQTDETSEEKSEATESSDETAQEEGKTDTAPTAADVTSSEDPAKEEPAATDDPSAQKDLSAQDVAPDAAAEKTDPEDAPPPSGTEDHTTDTTTTTATALPATTRQPAKGPGAAALVLGGIVAGAIGFAAAYFGLAQTEPLRDEALASEVSDLGRRVDAQSGTIKSLSEKVGGITNTDDAALEAQVEALGTLSERVAEAEETLEALDARLRDVEQGPVTESADSAAVAAYEAELDAARQELAAQREELQALIDEAMNTETAADEAAVAAMQRAAISRILAALDNGSGFAGAVAELQDTDVEVPDILVSTAESGVATLSSLQESFPDAARAALEASRDVTGEGTGLSGFLRNQLGVRSLEPREGSDPDAVLSRAEAAIRDGRLQDALAEIEALPEEGRAELSDWAGRATQRREALGAAQSLSETLN
ncbi:COG4223 family protein [Roseovarius sp. B08]|uniref:COG4223 family protein n=1 Tax=Roseovarius sp. B08 TaxID=3449223 RepID=UPI003EDBE67D